MRSTVFNRHFRQAIAFMLVILLCITQIPVAHGAQESAYHDPAEHWQSASSRTNELDINAVVTHETLNCAACGMETAFLVYRVPEYAPGGVSALRQGVKYSDGTMADGKSQGTIQDAVPGQDTYTGCHWTKSVCGICGTINSSMTAYDYSYGKNVYWLYDCAPEFTQALPETVTYTLHIQTAHTTPKPQHRAATAGFASAPARRSPARWSATRWRAPSVPKLPTGALWRWRAAPSVTTL